MKQKLDQSKHVIMIRWIQLCVKISRIQDLTRVKGLVHPKMKILSVFTHPHVVPNVFICSAEHKGRYLEVYGEWDLFD